jgi:hypothetical protein
MSAKNEFNTHGKRKKREAPFSLRLTFEERAKLEEAANGIPLFGLDLVGTRASSRSLSPEESPPLGFVVPRCTVW